MFPIRDTIPSKSPPITTWLLIFANSIVFFFEVGMPPQQLEGFMYLFGLVPARYMHPEWAAAVGLPFNDYSPFLTSMFLHGGWLHIILNMWALWIFGDNVEERMGSIRFLIFYLLCGLSGSVAHLLANPDSTVPAVGASGAIAGVLGAYLVLFPFARSSCMCRFSFFRSFLKCRPRCSSGSGRSPNCSAALFPWHTTQTSEVLPGGGTLAVSQPELCFSSFS